MSEMERAARLETFWARLVEHFGHDSAVELDCFEFTEYAEQAGLIRWEPYDETKHGEMDMDPGDMIWLAEPAAGAPTPSQGAPTGDDPREALIACWLDKVGRPDEPHDALCESEHIAPLGDTPCDCEHRRALLIAALHPERSEAIQGAPTGAPTGGEALRVEPIAVDDEALAAIAHGIVGSGKTPVELRAAIVETLVTLAQEVRYWNRLAHNYSDEILTLRAQIASRPDAGAPEGTTGGA